MLTDNSEGTSISFGFGQVVSIFPQSDYGLRYVIALFRRVHVALASGFQSHFGEGSALKASLGFEDAQEVIFEMELGAMTLPAQNLSLS